MTAEENNIVSESEPARHPFPSPSVEEARHILRELDWGEHFVGVEMNPAGGNRDTYIYSLGEAEKFLRHGNAGLSYSAAQGGSISWLDTDKFIAWIRDDVGDMPLADAVAGSIVDGSAYYGQVQTYGSLIKARLAQLTALLEEEDEAAIQ